MKEHTWRFVSYISTSAPQPLPVVPPDAKDTDLWFKPIGKGDKVWVLARVEAPKVARTDEFVLPENWNNKQVMYSAANTENPRVSLLTENPISTLDIGKELVWDTTIEGINLVDRTFFVEYLQNGMRDRQKTNLRFNNPKTHDHISDNDVAAIFGITRPALDASMMRFQRRLEDDLYRLPSDYDLEEDIVAKYFTFSSDSE